MILWKNGYIHTLENENTIKTDIVTHQGHIFSLDKIKGLQYDREIDLKGAHIFPGFVDAHLHIIGYGEKLNQIDLSSDDDLSSIQSRISEAISKGYITFYGLPLNIIDKHKLNDISLSHPIIVKHTDYHTYTVNDVVLNHSKIKSDTGIIDLDQMIEINKILSSYTNNDLVKLINLSIKKLHSFGITGGHSDDLHYFNGYYDTINAFKKSLKLHPFRTQLLMHYKEVDHFINSKDVFLDQNEFLQLGPVKIFYDGTISSKTALLKSPYKHTDSNGSIVMTKDGFIKEVIKARQNCLPVAIHVIGDKGLEDVLDILKNHPPKAKLNDRIIHASLISKKALNMMEGMPITIDVQPQFIKSDFPQSYQYFSTTPDYIYPFKTLMDHDVVLCASSDAPVEIPNPLLGIHALCTRKTLDGVLDEKEIISRFEAIKLYTIYANKPTYKQNRGLLKKGYIADFTIFNENLLTTPIDELLKIKPKYTVINEQIVYEDK